MQNINLLSTFLKFARNGTALLCAVLLIPGDTLLMAASEPALSVAQQDAATISPEQLDSLVAPIALYPDPLLAQVLAASTYPLEIIQLTQWLEKNKGLKDQALADAVSKQPWDPSVQALAAVPEVVKRLADDIQWTTDLGNAFLAQEADVMNAVQRMRRKAQDKGNLKTTREQTVETQVVEGKSVVVIQPASPEVVYVPSYNPAVVYGPPVYPYPPIAYPSAGYYAAGMAISFGVGMMMGAFWGGGGWGCGWGGNNIYVNRNNNFNRNTNIGGGNRGNIGGGNRGSLSGRNRPSQLPAGSRGGNDRWQHNPSHRGGAPYGDRGTANKFGGTARGDSLANRQASARQRVGQQGGNLSSRRGMVSNRGGAGVSNRPSGAGNRMGGGGADRIGSRDLSRSGGGGRDAFGGGSRGFNGSSARASSNRGASSMGSRGGASSLASRGGGGGFAGRGGAGGGRGSRGGGGGSRGAGRRR